MASLHTIIIGILFFSSVSATWAKDVPLEQLNERIDKVQSDIERNSSRRQDALNDLKSYDEQISETAKSIETHRRSIKRIQARTKELVDQKSRIIHSIGEQQAVLKDEILSAYLIGRQNTLKLVLNQRDPARLSRVLVYYDYFNRAHRTAIELLHDQNQALLDLEKQLARQKTLYEIELKEEETLVLDLQIKQQQRLAFVKRLTQRLKQEKRLLKHLLNNQERLGNLAQNINRKNPSNSKTIGTSFAKAKGKLHWPVKGQLKQRYGSQRFNTKLRWKGVLIAASEGADVKAVADGKVVFADWLRGYGFLIILDHGKGYMSLYGHNQRLNKKTGDKVNKGDVIAAVGSSGGQAESGLYFEIRASGKPQNPSNWLARR